jgi:hypothetical protein
MQTHGKEILSQYKQLTSILLDEHVTEWQIFHLEAALRTGELRYVIDQLPNEPEYHLILQAAERIHARTRNNGEEIVSWILQAFGHIGIVANVSTTSYDSSNYRYGNTSGNINNDGLVAIQDEWLYYSNVNKGDNLWKVHIDGTHMQKLNDDESYFINVLDNWVYYANCSDDWKLYKIHINGSKRQKLNNDDCKYIMVVCDWIYYCNANDGYSLYRIKVDGTDRQKLNNDNCGSINVVDEWVYYKMRYNDNQKLYKIKTDGTNRQKFMDDDIIGVCVESNWIYYCGYLGQNNEYGWRIYSIAKIGVDGKGKQKLVDDVAYNINVVDNWIYYINNGDNNHIYKLSADGTYKQKLNDDNCININIWGEWVFYVNMSDSEECHFEEGCDREYDDNLYRIRTNGSDRQKFVELELEKSQPIKTSEIFDIQNLDDDVDVTIANVYDEEPRDESSSDTKDKQGNNDLVTADEQYSLGTMHYEGNGMSQDYMQAAEWYHKAAEQGHAEAQCKLGLLYAKGEGVEQDIVTMFYWLGKAAEQGHAFAQGYFYSMSKGFCRYCGGLLSKIRRRCKSCGQQNAIIIFKLDIH